MLGKHGGFNGNYESLDCDWDDDGDVVLLACRDAIDRYGVVGLHPDAYASVQLQTPLICRPGDADKPYMPLLPQLRHTAFDMHQTRGHWAERRRERDRRKLLPPAPPPPEPRPSREYGRDYHPARPPGQQWRIAQPPQDWPQPTVTLAPPPPPEPEEPPLPAIEAPTLESALRQFYRLYEGQGINSRTKALYRSTVLRFMPGYRFPDHLR